jgi:hypothetical protein
MIPERRTKHMLLQFGDKLLPVPFQVFTNFSSIRTFRWVNNPTLLKKIPEI